MNQHNPQRQTPPTGPEAPDVDDWYRPGWVPLCGNEVRLAGVRFDAVRVHGVQGEDIAERYVRLIEDVGVRGETGPGPVICEASGFRWMYFLLPPCTAADLTWPRSVQLFGGGTRTVGYVCVPALEGNTWPLYWHSRPTRTAPYVHPQLLNEAAHEARSLPVRR